VADQSTVPSNRGMGRGLAAILSTSKRDESDGSEPAALRELALELIAPNPRQPRGTFDDDALIALSESIKARGVLQPVVVRALAGGRYELVAGERRLRASELAGLETIPAIVREADESERLELALIENMAREDLNPVEEARACATLVEDLGISKEELARRVGRSRPAVSNLIRLLALPDEVLELIGAGHLSEGHGRAILICKDHGERRRLGREAHAEGWSVRQTEARAREASLSPAPRIRSRADAVHPDLAEALAAASDTLTAALGREVHVRPRGTAFRVEFDVEHPSEAVELAERMLARDRSETR
jgi:ParB family transcriptional regulator, chromosome partitioning protein